MTPGLGLSGGGMDCHLLIREDCEGSRSTGKEGESQEPPFEHVKCAMLTLLSNQLDMQV